MDSGLNQLVGASRFGAGKNYGASVNIYNRAVYVHLKDRNSGNRVSLKPSDFVCLYQIKDKVFNNINKANRIILKHAQKSESVAATDDDESIYSSDSELEEAVEVIKKSKKSQKSKPEISDSPASDSGDDSQQSKQPTKKKRSSESTDEAKGKKAQKTKHGKKKGGSNVNALAVGALPSSVDSTNTILLTN